MTLQKRATNPAPTILSMALRVWQQGAKDLTALVFILFRLMQITSPAN